MPEQTGPDPADSNGAVSRKTGKPGDARSRSRPTAVEGAGRELVQAARVSRSRPTDAGIAASASTAPVPGPTDDGADPGPRRATVAIRQGGADRVSADTVSITQGGASTVNARSVEVRQGGIAIARADDIAVSMGGVALARADRVSVEMGGIGIALAREAHLTQGAARSIIAREVRVDQGLVGSAIASQVSFARPSGVLLLIAGRVDGPVRALLDWRGALAFGAAFGLLFGLIRRR